MTDDRALTPSHAATAQRDKLGRILPRDLRERFNEKVDRSAGPLGCWIWTGSFDPYGYGKIANRSTHDSPRMAHRIAYELFVGPIPDGLQLDHLCRTPACVNPLHLEPVTQAENLRRGRHWNAEKTHCKRGHAFNDTNTYIRPDGCRTCRDCVRINWQRRRAA